MLHVAFSDPRSSSRSIDDLLCVRVIGRPGLTVLRCHDLTLERFDLSTDQPPSVGEPLAFEFTCNVTAYSVVLWAKCVHCHTPPRHGIGYFSAWEFMGEATDAYAAVEHLVGCLNVRRRATAVA